MIVFMILAWACPFKCMNILSVMYFNIIYVKWHNVVLFNLRGSKKNTVFKLNIQNGCR